MRQRSSPHHQPLRRLLGQLDRIFGEINAALIAIAIGLAMLDYTYLVWLKISAALLARSR